ncbi:hypothetical protein [Thermus albus]|uniref:hypothetical protein n=1 Tax=Thermus albus TaxID=2908146 RepID=UPI001FA95F63|nr:hypothetical protein [Thermus albus]
MTEEVAWRYRGLDLWPSLEVLEVLFDAQLWAVARAGEVLARSPGPGGVAGRDTSGLSAPLQLRGATGRGVAPGE